MSETKISFKWWWAWSPEKLENWLEDMESKGWQLFRIGGGAIIFHFKKGMPRKISYCVDYQSKVEPEYLNLFEDAGWKLVYSGMGWYIWSLKYEGAKPEIYTDIDSLIRRNKSIVKLILILIAVNIPNVTSVTRIVKSGGSSKTWLAISYMLIYGILFYGLIKFIIINRKLKER